MSLFRSETPSRATESDPKPAPPPVVRALALVAQKLADAAAACAAFQQAALGSRFTKTCDAAAVEILAGLRLQLTVCGFVRDVLEHPEGGAN